MIFYVASVVGFRKQGYGGWYPGAVLKNCTAPSSFDVLFAQRLFMFGHVSFNLFECQI